ncbi:hypothetical protein NCS57_00902500 [Fusarium keratoplasticum]|uniref:Uncharacterized protein n=1 Tax=Fusarium keratoplasticum TaxID=1328300 RepID=A0ACC0QXR2_9HYPO|nr:hypothetical protein NCS57_00902500 [Fusarium keratoplasticum]KAI8666761.1 hypothetical protein NCS57_00902500 [Fusarium keratoplasticum]
MRSLITLSALAISSAWAHVIMVEPHPFNLDTAPFVQVDPLGPDAPFPCQGRTQHPEEVTKVTAGTTQKVKFWGSAVHAGGSCQFSISHGKDPSKDVKGWRTIYSIIGGCPAEAQGNIPSIAKDPQGREHGPECSNDSGKECIREFDIPIPMDMQNGPAVFAWTWFNKLGNREMYMVCAPIEVVGGKDDSSFVDTLPPPFVANIPGQCTTGQGVLGFPEPGDFGKVLEPASHDESSKCPAAADPNFKEPAGGDAAPKPEIPSKPASSVAAQPSVPAPEKPSEGGDVIFITAPTGATSAAGAPTQQPVAPSAGESAPIASSVNKPAPSSQPAASAPAPVPSTDDSSSGSNRPWWAVGMEPCPVPGQLVCMSPTFFGLCNRGWALPQAVPQGTKCLDGQIVVDV